MSTAKSKKYAKKAIKVLMWLVVSFLSLFILITILLQFPSVQTRLVTMITSQISSRVDTPVHIDRVAIRFPKSVGLKGIYFEDTRGDTLLYAGSIFVDVGMLGLFRNQVNVNKLELEDVVANMKREQPDTVFNFQFLVDAFAGDDQHLQAEETIESEKVEPGNGWEVSVKRVQLQNIRYLLHDHFSGTDLHVQVENFNTNLADADLLSERYHTREITLTKPRVAIRMQPPAVISPPDTTDTGMPLLDIFVEALHVSDLHFLFDSHDGTNMDIKASRLELEPETIQLHNFLIAIKTLSADQLTAHFNFPETSTTDEPIELPQTDAPFQFDFADIMDWDITLGHLALSRSSFSMVQGKPSPSPEFNPENIQLSGINLELNNVRVTPNTLNASIRNTSMVFSDALQIRNLQTDIALGNQTRISDFALDTEMSTIRLSLSSPQSFLKFSQEDLERYELEFSITETTIKEDLAWLAPAMNSFYFNWPENRGLMVNMAINGSLSNLKIGLLRLNAPGFFSINTQGAIQGLPQTDQLAVDIPVLQLNAIPYRFFTNLPDTLQPEGITLPGYIRAESVIKGSMKDLTATLDVETNFGNLYFQGKLNDTLPDESAPAFAARLFSEGFDVARLLNQQELIEQVPSFDLVMEGKGFDPHSMQLYTTLSIANLALMGYAYEPLQLELSLADSIAGVKTGYQDEHLAFSLQATYGAFKAVPKLITYLELNYAQLGRLGLYDGNMLARTNIKTDLVFDIEDFFNGEIEISETAIALEGEIYELPSFYVISKSSPQNYSINLQSTLADASFAGNFSPALIPGVLATHLTQYYDLPFYEADTLAGFEEKQFEMNLNLRPDELITKVIMTDMDHYDTLRVNVSYNNRVRELIMEASWPGLTYGSIVADNFNAQIVSDLEQLNYSIKLNRLEVGDIRFNDFETRGTFIDQNLSFIFGFKDAMGSPLYGFSGNLTGDDSLFTVHIKPENLLLNGEHWNIPENNLITFGEKHLTIQNFFLESDGRELRLQTREHAYGYPVVDVALRQLDLGRLTDFSGSEFPTIGGLFNGDASVMNFFEEPAFIANLTVDDFAFQGDTIGHIVLKAENPQPDLFDLFASLKSDETDLEISGIYRTGENKGVDIDLALKKLDLQAFEGFTAGNITHLEGFLSADMKVTGTTDNPFIAGELNINNTSFRVPAINAGYFLKSERIVFDRQHIRLQNIALEDSTGRQANLNGNINFSDLNQLAFNLNLSSRNFLLMNLRPGQNEMYHGRILMDSDLRLRGNQHNPTVEGRIRLNEGSNFTFVLPQTAPEAIGDEGIVEFVRFGDELFYQLALAQTETEPMMSSFERLDLSVNIEVDPQTDVRIIIDEFAGDFLEVRGGGQLSFGIDPGGRISLSGRYEIVDGEYLLTFYDVIRRNFRIRSGSNIVWTGDPLKADIDITAIYTVRTNARELLVSQMGGDQFQSAALRQQFPFLVYLNMKGNLDEPDISFEIDLPPEHQNAMDGTLMARINQINQHESERNKQVFALLILGGFIQENPFAAMGGGDLTTTARNSASQILTQQLNRLSDRYVRGVDINIEVESFVDFEDGQGTGRTELQMEVSRDFFDDRVRITVGGNIELEDDARRQTNPGDIAGDFTIEYLLTPAGNLRLKGFRTKNYADIFEGEVIETGISLIFSRSYNRFRDLFKREEEAEIQENDF